MTCSAVVFDWYATLARPDPDDWWVRLPDLVVDAGGQADLPALRAWEHDHPVEHRDRSTDEVTFRRWQRDRLAHLFTSCGVPEPARTELLDRIEQERYTRLFEIYPDVLPTLDHLRSGGLTVGICSNWDWDLDRHLERTGIADLVDFVVCSAQVGYRKPHPAIFTEVLGRTGSAAGATLFVGDNWYDDVSGALGAGLRPVHVVRSAACRVDEHDGVPCAPDLDSVVALAHRPRSISSP